MRLSTALGLAAVSTLITLLWWAGGFALLGWWLVGLQREFQTILAAQVSALRGGAPHALAGLLGFCAAYGFLHAAGPGHGKLLVAGTAIGSMTTARRMAAIAITGSLAQALFAILLIYGGLAVIGASARATIGASEAWALPAGHAAVAAIGTVIALRGLRAWPGRHTHDHGHAHGPACGCGHHYGPDAREITAARGLAGAAALVGAMALRPCAGAMMLLAIAWSMGLAAAGALGVLAMGLGTAAFTVAVALLAVSGRATALAGFGGGRRGARLLSALQLGTGLLLALSGATLLLASLHR